MLIKTFLIIWSVILTDGLPVASVRIKIPQDNMEVCPVSLQGTTIASMIDNKEYWAGYDIMVTAECALDILNDNGLNK